MYLKYIFFFSVFKETLLMLVTLVVYIRSRPASNPPITCIQFDESTKDLVSEMLLLVDNLSKDTTKSKEKIVSNFMMLPELGIIFNICESFVAIFFCFCHCRLICM